MAAIIGAAYFGLSAVGCGGSNSGSKDDDTLMAAISLNWLRLITGDSVQVHNRVVASFSSMVRLEYTFGVLCHKLQGMARGDVDITMEVWQDITLNPGTK